MKRVSLIIFILISIFKIYSQEIIEKKIVFNETVYDPFFSVVVKDNEGEKFNVTRLAFFDEYNDKKFFFWVRRNSGLYNLSFKNIKRVSFDADDFADSRYIDFTRCNIELVTGESFLLYLKTTGHLEGFDSDFSSPVTFYLHYNLIESIEFNHDGEYSICQFCENIYFDDNIKECLYDKTPLVKGVLEVSDK